MVRILCAPATEFQAITEKAFFLVSLSKSMEVWVELRTDSGNTGTGSEARRSDSNSKNSPCLATTETPRMELRPVRLSRTTTAFQGILSPPNFEHVSSAR